MPRVSTNVSRFPHRANLPIHRKSGILWNGDVDNPIRVVDLRDGELREIEKG